jgi:iron-sulfur cluster repair protein YtfE (RIC family)
LEATTAHVDDEIAQVFGKDHERLREIMSRAIAACDRGDDTEARRLVEAYDTGLRRHIQAEEDVLFPAFEGRTGLRDAGPTAVMRREHREIERHLAAARDAFGAKPELELGKRHLVAVQTLLADHDRREEQVLYPACDRLLTERETRASAQALSGESRDEGGPDHDGTVD